MKAADEHIRSKHGMSMKDYIVQKLQEGERQADIAKEVGITRGALHYWMALLGIRQRKIIDVVD